MHICINIYICCEKVWAMPVSIAMDSAHLPGACLRQTNLTKLHTTQEEVIYVYIYIYTYKKYIHIYIYIYIFAGRLAHWRDGT